MQIYTDVFAQSYTDAHTHTLTLTCTQCTSVHTQEQVQLHTVYTQTQRHGDWQATEDRDRHRDMGFGRLLRTLTDTEIHGKTRYTFTAESLCAVLFGRAHGLRG